MSTSWDHWEVKHFVLEFIEDHGRHFSQEVRDCVVQDSEGETEAPVALPSGVVNCHSMH